MTKMLSEILQQPDILADIYTENIKNIESLADEIRAKSIKYVVFAARGTSYHASIYGQYILALKCSMQSATALPSCVTVYKSAPFSEDELIIGVSQSGQAADVLEVINAAAGRGALTAAITNDCESPMAVNAKHHIYCAAGREISVAATKTFTAEMAAILLTAAKLANDTALINDFKNLHVHVKKTLDTLNGRIQDIARAYIHAGDGFVISRGLTYPVALEASLKLQETCYIKMKGYSAADFMHGPIAQIDSKTPVIVFIPSGSVFNDCLNAARRIRSAGGDVLIVTDNAELASEEPGSVLLPNTGNELTSPFVFAIFAQLLAESLSGLRGLNPDSPRNLKKITVTV